MQGARDIDQANQDDGLDPREAARLLAETERCPSRLRRGSVSEAKSSAFAGLSTPERLVFSYL